MEREIVATGMTAVTTSTMVTTANTSTIAKITTVADTIKSILIRAGYAFAGIDSRHFIASANTPRPQPISIHQRIIGVRFGLRVKSPEVLRQHVATVVDHELAIQGQQCARSRFCSHAVSPTVGRHLPFRPTIIHTVMPSSNGFLDSILRCKSYRGFRVTLGITYSTAGFIRLREGAEYE